MLFPLSVVLLQSSVKVKAGTYFSIHYRSNGSPEFKKTVASLPLHPVLRERLLLLLLEMCAKKSRQPI